MTKYIIKTNYKYLSKNPISRCLVNNFNKQIKNIIQQLSFNSLLDVGCGEGITLKILESELIGKECIGLDLDKQHIEMSKVNAPYCKYMLGNIYNLPFNKNTFDVTLCLEVLEHLENPEKAIYELHKISAKYIIISVPREPIWRMLNMFRGKYWNNLGNTPGHLNHWSSSSIIALLKKSFKIVDIRQPIPWTIVLAEKNR